MTNRSMVEHNRKYTFRFRDKKIVFGKLAHEPELQVYAKALAFGLYHKKYPTIRVEPKLDGRFQPDLSANGYDGAMLFWAECGHVSVSKIEKLFKKYRQAHFVFIKEEKDIPAFEKHLSKIAKEMHSLPLVDIVVYPEHFKDWYVSDEGDVFIPKDGVSIIRWHEPKGRVKYY